MHVTDSSVLDGVRVDVDRVHFAERILAPKPSMCARCSVTSMHVLLGTLTVTRLITASLKNNFFDLRKL